MHSIDMLVPLFDFLPTDNKVEKNNNVDFSEISATFKEVVENQKEVNEKLTNSINEVVNKLTSAENIKREWGWREWVMLNRFIQF